jgi:hypothetical protein
MKKRERAELIFFKKLSSFQAPFRPTLLLYLDL